MIPPAETMIGSLLRYITRADVKDFQPINSNWGIFPILDITKPIKDKRLRHEKLAERALSAMRAFSEQQGMQSYECRVESLAALAT